MQPLFIVVVGLRSSNYWLLFPSSPCSSPCCCQHLEKLVKPHNPSNACPISAASAKVWPSIKATSMTGRLAAWDPYGWPVTSDYSTTWIGKVGYTYNKSSDELAGWLKNPSNPLACPSHTFYSKVGSSTIAASSYLKFGSYGWNFWMLGSNDGDHDWLKHYFKPSMISLPPSTRLLFFDNWGYKSDGVTVRWSGYWSKPSVGNASLTNDLGMTFPHAGATNALWYDGHASTADAFKVGLSGSNKVLDDYWHRN